MTPAPGRRGHVLRGLVLLAFPLAPALLLVVAGLLLVQDRFAPLAAIPAVLLMAVALGTTMALVTALRAVRGRPYERDVVTSALTRYDAPGLWAVVDDVVRTVGAPAVDHLKTGEAVNARAHLGGGRTLYLGLPLLGVLTVGGLRSVVGHELSHLAEAVDEPRWVAWLQRLAEAGSRAGGVGALVAGVVEALGAVVSAAARRAGELRADTWSLRVATREEAVQALRSTTPAYIAAGHWFSTYALPFTVARVRGPMTEAFARFAGAPPAEVQRLVREAYAARARFGDDHPGPGRREQALLALPLPDGAPTRADDRPAISLLPPVAVLAAEAAFLGLADVPVLTWGDAVSQAAAAALVDDAQACRQRCTGARVTTYDELLAAIGRDELPVPEAMPAVVLGSPSVAAEPPRTQGRLDADLVRMRVRAYQLAQVVGAALVETTDHRPVPHWPGYVVVDPASAGDVRAAVELHGPLRVPSAEAAVAAARALARRYGADLSVAPGSVRPLPDRVLAMATAVQGPWPDRRDLIVMVSGLLALPVTPADPDDATRMEAHSRTEPHRLRERPGAWWLPWDAVTGACVGEGVDIDLETADGTIGLWASPRRSVSTPDVRAAVERCLLPVVTR